MIVLSEINYRACMINVNHKSPVIFVNCVIMGILEKPLKWKSITWSRNCNATPEVVYNVFPANFIKLFKLLYSLALLTHYEKERLLLFCKRYSIRLQYIIFFCPPFVQRLIRDSN